MPFGALVRSLKGAAMAFRFHFTSRDWIWFCIVFALAVGWSGHFQYTKWLENNVLHERYASSLKLRNELSAAHEKAFELKAEVLAVQAALETFCTPGQRKQIEDSRASYVPNRDFVERSLRSQ